jgi:hypothetical protein
MNNDFSTLKRLSLAREGQRRRGSSWDHTGGNNDCVGIPAGESLRIFDVAGAGCISHIWMTMDQYPRMREYPYLRQCVIRMYWDGEQSPSVEVPFGDFFGMGHAMTKNFTSAPLSMGPEGGKSFNCFFAMPFAEGARIEICNEYSRKVRLYFYIDYEEYQKLSADYLRFHASWHRENPCKGIDPATASNAFYSFGGENLNGYGNYPILEAEGSGHYVGCHLDIHNLRSTRDWNWYGEGDDMIFIDGNDWPPTLHGTGTEDYFNTAWCPTEDVCTPYSGVILAGDKNWSGRVSLYRYHIEDPVMFSKSIHVTIEHGHNNNRSDDYSSTAYWYQREPHRRLAPLLPPAERLPLPDVIPIDIEETKKYINL